MHASLNIAPQFLFVFLFFFKERKKKERKFNWEILVTFVVLVLRFSLAYFSWCDCSWVVIFPSRHLSPCQHGEAHCRQYPCLWIHIDDALLLSCDSPPWLTTIGFFLQPWVGWGLFCNAKCVPCFERDLSVFCLWRKVRRLPSHKCLHDWGGRSVDAVTCKWTSLRSASRKHLYFFLFFAKLFFLTNHLCEYSCLGSF